MGLTRNEHWHSTHSNDSMSIEEVEEFAKAVIAGGEILEKYLASKPKREESEECRCTLCENGKRAMREWTDELLGRKDEHQITTQQA